MRQVDKPILDHGYGALMLGYWVCCMWYLQQWFRVLSFRLNRRLRLDRLSTI